MAKAKKTKLLFTVSVAIVIAAVTILALPAKKTEPDTSPASGLSSHRQTNNQPVFDKAKYPVDQASSLWVVVNKGRVLPSSYIPADLVVPDVPLRLSASSPEMHVRADMASALESLFAAAKSNGINLKLESGYRSYNEQAAVYSGYVSQDGTAKADTYSARPGHSEHQTGLAADLEPLDRTCEVEQCFENTPEGKWLAANSYKYGLIIRYQKNTQALTGYEYEPWHVRYVGADLALILQQNNQTLEQFFGLPIYTNYPAASYEIKNL